MGSEDQGIKLDTCITTAGTLDIDSDPSVADRLRPGLRVAGALNKVDSLRAARNMRPYSAKFYMRNMGNGVLVKTRTTFAAIRVFNRHWGVFHHRLQDVIELFKPIARG